MSQAKVEGIDLFICIEDDGTEGLVGASLKGSGVYMPMATTNPDLIASMIPVALEHARRRDVVVELRFFGGAPRVVEVFHPDGTRSGPC